jgi:hypothetical protein
MKKLPLKTLYEYLSEFGLQINETFLEATLGEIPILNHVEILLSSVSEKGLKLTAKGNLPTKVVEQIATTRPTLSDSRYLKFTKRFLEEEQISAMRVRLYCEVLKLIKVEKGKLYLTVLAKTYLASSKNEKYLFLFSAVTKLNVGFFDRYQESSLVQSLAYPYLQLVRDKEAKFRETAVYNAFLLDQYPRITDSVETEIKPDHLDTDCYDVFESIVEFRLLKNFYVPFGLLEERGISYKELYQVSKTKLLDQLFISVNSIDKSRVLNSKIVRDYENRIREENLVEMELFTDIGYFFVSQTCLPIFDKEKGVEAYLKEKKLLGLQIDRQRQFYNDLIQDIEITVHYFTQLEKKGEQPEELKKDFESFVALFSRLVLVSERPYTIFMTLQKMSEFILSMLSHIYKIDIIDGTSFEKFEDILSEETYDDLMMYLNTLGHLHEKTRKAKRVTKEIKNIVHDVILSSVILSLSLYTFHLESE